MQNQDTPGYDDPNLFNHNDFVLRRDRVLDTFDRHAPLAEVDAGLDALLHQMRSQFDREERAMQAVQFPPAAAHKSDHDRACADLAHRIARWKSERDREAMLDFIEAGLADWFVRHVNTRDYITARYLADPRVR